MPILYRDPWRRQFFDRLACPEGVAVPVKDYDAYVLYPEFRWVYNKLLVAEKQGLLCAPHGVVPAKFPVFSKPIYNLNTMGAESRLLRNVAEYLHHRKAGHMWSELLVGDHISTDVLIFGGCIVWHSHTRGHPLEEGTFDRWEVNVEYDNSLIRYLHDFVRQHLHGFDGPINIETIGGKIIEMHLRFADQWPDLYPPFFMEAVVMLRSGKFTLSSDAFKVQAKGYSVILFARRRRNHWKKPPEREIQSLLRLYNISSIQLPFDEWQPAEQHSMPPGGFRLAILNGFTLEECLRAREDLKECFRKMHASSDPVDYGGATSGSAPATSGHDSTVKLEFIP